MSSEFTPNVYRMIGKSLSVRNAAKLALVSKRAQESMANNLRRRKVTKRTQTLAKAAGKMFGTRANNYRFYKSVLSAIRNLKNMNNKGDGHLVRPLTNANLNALRYKVLQNMTPFPERNNTNNKLHNRVWKLNNNIHLHGIVGRNFPYNAMNVFVYKRQPNGKYAQYDVGGYLTSKNLPRRV